MAPKEWVESAHEGMKEMALQQCKTDPCVWKLVKGTSWGPHLQVLALFHIDDVMLAGRKREAGWEEFQRRMQAKWKWPE